MPSAMELFEKVKFAKQKSMKILKDFNKVFK